VLKEKKAGVRPAFLVTCILVTKTFSALLRFSAVIDCFFTFFLLKPLLAKAAKFFSFNLNRCLYLLNRMEVEPFLAIVVTQKQPVKS
jgi:hypothetical protein